MAIEVVDFPINSMVDLSIAFCMFTRPGNHKEPTNQLRASASLNSSLSWGMFGFSGIVWMRLDGDGHGLSPEEERKKPGSSCSKLEVICFLDLGFEDFRP